MMGGKRGERVEGFRPFLIISHRTSPYSLFLELKKRKREKEEEEEEMVPSKWRKKTILSEWSLS